MPITPKPSSCYFSGKFLFQFSLVLFLSSFHSSFAQQPEYIHYDSKNGLGHDLMTFRAFKDSKGLMWFVSPAGITRYDGYDFDQYRISEGLLYHSVLSVSEGSDEKLWFLLYPGQLMYFDKERLHPYPHNDSIVKYTRQGRLLTYNIDKEGKLYLGGSYTGYFEVDKDGNVNQLIKQHGGYHGVGLVLQDSLNPLVFAISDSLKLDEPRSIYIFDKHLNLISEFPVDTTGVPFTLKRWTNPLAITKKDGSILFAFEQRLVHLNKDSVIHYHIDEHLYTSISEDEQGAVWASKAYSGTAYYANGDISQKPDKSYLPEQTHLWASKDNEGGIWLASEMEGVFYAPFPNIFWYKKKDVSDNLLLQQTEVNDSGIIYSHSRESVIKIENGQSKIIKLKGRDFWSKRTSINSIAWDNKSNTLLVGLISSMAYIDEKDSVFFIPANDGMTPKGYVKQIVPSRFGDFYWILSNFAVLKLENHKYTDRLKRTPDRLRCLAEGKNGELWLGGSKGLWRYKNGEYEFFAEDYKGIQGDINDLYFSNNNLWISTKRGELYQWDGKRLLDFKTLKKPVKRILRTFIEGDTCWAMSDHHLYKMVPIGNDEYKIYRIQTNYSQFTANLNLTIFGDTAYLSSNEGLAYLNIRKDRPKVNQPAIWITKLRINNRDTAILPVYNLEYDQDYIQIAYSALSYHSEGELMYRYCMIGVDKKWNYDDERSKQYTKLTPGSYTFQICGKGVTENWSDPISIQFNISPPFWATWWFRITIGLTILIGILLFFQWRLKRLNEKRRVEQELLKLESKALRAQINPHFIFNVLTAIQSYVSKSDTLSSEIYLGKFSRLIRLILENSRESFIPLGKELESLRYYLEMEQMRYDKGRFQFFLQVDSAIDINAIYLPPMLVQPYAENAVIHGLTDKKEGGIVEINFNKNNDSLICEIIDNGVGRKSHKTQSDQREHQPLGMLITKERLELLNKGATQNLKIKIEDLNSDLGKTGTKVTLTIPIKSSIKTKAEYANADY